MFDIPRRSRFEMNYFRRTTTFRPSMGSCSTSARIIQSSVPALPILRHSKCLEVLWNQNCCQVFFFQVSLRETPSHVATKTKAGVSTLKIFEIIWNRKLLVQVLCFRRFTIHLNEGQNPVGQQLRQLSVLFQIL